MNTNPKATTLKGKCHIIQRKYKVNGFMKTISHKLQIEIGAAYLREAHEYVDYMINGFYELPRLHNPDYTNDEERFSIDENKEVIDRLEY
jgi:hypothetical protein